MTDCLVLFLAGRVETQHPWLQMRFHRTKDDWVVLEKDSIDGQGELSGFQESVASPSHPVLFPSPERRPAVLCIEPRRLRLLHEHLGLCPAIFVSASLFVSCFFEGIPSIVTTIVMVG